MKIVLKENLVRMSPELGITSLRKVNYDFLNISNIYSVSRGVGGDIYPVSRGEEGDI